MKTLRILAPAFGAVLLALTYLLVAGTTPDPAHHERILAAMRSLILNDSALQRDVLKARAGLLRNYDSLVQSSENLRHAIDSLRAELQPSPGREGAMLRDRLRALAAAVRDQQELIETFKSSNALLQNSLSFFNHIIRQLGDGGVAAPEVAPVSNAMLRFVSDPLPGLARDVNAAL